VTPEPQAESAALATAWAVLIEGLLDAGLAGRHRKTLRIAAANKPAATLLGVDAWPSCAAAAWPSLSATAEDIVFWNEAARRPDADAILSDTLVRRFDGTIVPVTRRVSRLDAPPVPTCTACVYAASSRCRIAASSVRPEDELEVRVAELRATLESTADGILVTDLAGRHPQLQPALRRAVEPAGRRC
jgi:PAS domain-containing protein